MWARPGSVLVTRFPRSHEESRGNDWGFVARVWGQRLGTRCREHMGVQLVVCRRSRPVQPVDSRTPHQHRDSETQLPVATPVPPTRRLSCGCGGEDGLGQPWFISFFIRYLRLLLCGFRLWWLSSRLSEIKGSLSIDGMPILYSGLEEVLLANGFTPQTYEPNQD